MNWEPQLPPPQTKTSALSPPPRGICARGPHAGKRAPPLPGTGERCFIPSSHFKKRTAAQRRRHGNASTRNTLRQIPSLVKDKTRIAPDRRVCGKSMAQGTQKALIKAPLWPVAIVKQFIPLTAQCPAQPHKRWKTRKIFPRFEALDIAHAQLHFFRKLLLCPSPPDAQDSDIDTESSPASARSGFARRHPKSSRNLAILNTRLNLVSTSAPEIALRPTKTRSRVFKMSHRNPQSVLDGSVHQRKAPNELMGNKGEFRES